MSKRSANRRGPSEARTRDHVSPPQNASAAALDPALEASKASIGLPLNDDEQHRRADALKASQKSHKLGAEKLTPEEQRRRFIEAAREAGASEDEADFDAALKRIAKSPEGRATRPSGEPSD